CTRPTLCRSPVGDQPALRSGVVAAGEQQLGEVLGVLRAGVDHPHLVLVAQHVAVGAGERHGAGVVGPHHDQLDRRGVGSPLPEMLVHRGPAQAVGARDAESSTTSSSSTGASRGSTATPTAERAWLPASPKTSPSRVLAPLITAGWPVNEG